MSQLSSSGMVTTTYCTPFEIAQIVRGGELGHVDFGEGFDDAFGLRLREAALLQLLNHCIFVDGERCIRHKWCIDNCSMHAVARNAARHEGVLH